MQTNQNDIFIGRGALVDRLREIARDAAIVLVHGSPGVGKSRLAARAYDRTGENCAWIDVSMARDERDLVAATSRALDVEVQSDESVETGRERVALALEAADRLEAVVFDDFDPLVPEGASLLADWAKRSSAPVVVTCRQRLGVSSTRPIRVPPLEREQAVRLFAEYARQVRPSFRIDRHREAVAELVEALDRLPYAIELAARRIRVLTPDDMLERLDERFSLLRNRRSVEDEAMELALEWSWQWLEPAERQFLKQCCALTAPASASALEAIVELETDAPWLDVFDSLVAKSWLQSEPVEALDGELRFRLLNTVRAFVEQRDVEGSDATSVAAARRRAAAHFCEVAVEWGPEVTGADGPRALARLDVDRDHLVEAAEYWLERDDARAVDLVVGIRWIALLRGPIYQYESLVERAIELAETLGSAVAEALLRDTAAQIDLLMGRRERAMSTIRRALEVAEQGSASVQATVGRTAGLVESASAPRRARKRLESALERAEKVDDAFLRARILERLGYVDIRLFQLDRAEEEFRRAEELFGGGTSPLFEADSLSGIAYVAHRQNRLDEAIATFQDVTDVHRRNAAPTSFAGAMFNLGVCHHIVGALQQAEACIQKALDDWRRLGLTYYLPAGQIQLAVILFERAAHEACDEMLAEARSTADETGDLQTVAKCRGFQAIREWMVEGHGDLEALEQARAQIDSGADPDVAAALSVAILAMIGADEDDRTAPLSRIEELLAVLSPADRYLQEVLERLLAIGRSFDRCRAARAAVDGPNRREFAQQAVAELASVLTFETNAELAATVAALPNPWVRLLGGQLVAELQQLGVAVDSRETGAEHILEVHSNCHWYCVDDGEPVDLSNRKPTRLIFKHILQTHLDDPDAALDVETLMEAGWPDDYMTFESGRSRVYAAIKYLRDHDLSGVIETTDDGYRIAESVDVRVAPTTGLQVSS